MEYLMYFLLSNIALSVVTFFLTHGLIASEESKHDYEKWMVRPFYGRPHHCHEEPSDIVCSSANVDLKKEERDKLPHGSLYELVGVDLDSKNGFATQLPDEVKKLYSLDLESDLDSKRLFPRLSKRDKLALRAVNSDFRKKFIIINNAIVIDLTIDPADALRTLNTTKYVFNDDGIFVLDNLPFKNSRSQMLCNLVRDGLLKTDRLYLENYNNSGFRRLLNEVQTVSALRFSLDQSGTTGLAVNLAKHLPKNSHIRSIDLSHSDKSMEDQKALKAIIVNNTGLERLDLCHGGIDDVGFLAIAEGLENNTSVTEVNLRGHSAKGQGLEALMKIFEKNKTLTDLDLCGSKITIKDIEQMQKSLEKNTTMKRLFVGNSFLNDPAYNRHEDVLIKVNSVRKKDPRITI
jgi:hypothetical protein